MEETRRNHSEEIEGLLSEHFRSTTTAGSRALSKDAAVEADDDVRAGVDRGLIDAAVAGRVKDFADCTNDNKQGTEQGAVGPSGDNRHDDGKDEDDDDPNYGTDTDRTIIKTFLQTGCGCRRKCEFDLDMKTILDHILCLREMPKPEKELFLMDSLEHEAVDDTTKRGKKRKRSRIDYIFNGKSVCRKTFMLVFDVGRYTLQSLVTHVKQGDLTPRIHGNLGRKPKHAMEYEDVKRVIDFILTFADTYGLPPPEEASGTDNFPLVYLERECTKRMVHQNYLITAEEESFRAVKQSTFYGIWSSCLGHIKVSTQREDVCGSCDKHKKTCIVKADQENDKLQATNDFKMHIEEAQKERIVYSADDPGSR